MRRSDRELPRNEALAILTRGEYGTLSLVDSEGLPYAVPMNYAVSGDCIHFHGALEGTKIDALESTAHAAFCVVGETRILPASFSTLYESCIVRGPVKEVFGEDKQKALEGLIIKYSVNYLEEGLKYIDKLIDHTRVFALCMDEVSGKIRT